ncbi:MAG: substrate-binding periplasmic protein [Kordiimonas sp.]
MKALLALGMSLIMTILLAPQQVNAACAKPLLIAYSDWSRAAATPALENNKEYGLDFELLQGILQMAECPFVHRPIPFKRIQEAIRHGTIDGTMGSSLTVPRQEYAWFTEPYRQEIMAMFMLKDEVFTFKPKTVEDLAKSGYRVGLGMGSWHGAKFENLVRTNEEFKARVLLIDDFNLMYQWLQRGRVDVAINDVHYGYYVLKRHNLLDQIVPHPFPINASDIHIMLSKASVSNEDATKISEAVGRFRDTQAYHQIIEKYAPK